MPNVVLRCLQVAPSGCTLNPLLQRAAEYSHTVRVLHGTVPWSPGWQRTSMQAAAAPNPQLLASQPTRAQRCQSWESNPTASTHDADAGDQLLLNSEQNEVQMQRVQALGHRDALSNKAEGASTRMLGGLRFSSTSRDTHAALQRQAYSNRSTTNLPRS
jgi:hypothetical protein